MKLLIKWLFSWIIASLTDILIVWILINFLSFNYLIAVFIWFNSGNIVNYIIYNKFIFKTKNNTKNDYLIFSLLAVIWIFVTILGVYLLVKFLNFDPLIAKIIFTFIVFIINFYLRKFFIYNKNKKWLTL